MANVAIILPTVVCIYNKWLHNYIAELGFLTYYILLKISVYIHVH